MSKKKVEIEMLNGGKKDLKDLTEADLPNIKLTFKVNPITKEKEPNLTMKTTILKSDVDFDHERRLFKWTTMPNLVMYTLPKPKNMKAFQSIKTNEEILEFAIDNYAIAQDKANNGVVSQGADPIKAGNKLYANLDNLKDENGNPISKKDIEDLKKQMQACGFGK